MNPRDLPKPGDTHDELAGLISTLVQTEQRIREVTAGEVDAVIDEHGRTFVLQHAQESLRYRESLQQSAILDALPANIALVDAQGLILSTNESWRNFECASSTAAHSPGPHVGLNYLWLCDSAMGEGSSEAHQAAAGIRSVISGECASFALEYACHSPDRQRWFLMRVTPLCTGRPTGAIVMHVDITDRMLAEIALRQSLETLEESATRVRHLNRVHSMLSGINSLIVRASNRDQLFQQTCQIAVERGGFNAVFAGIVDRASGKVVPVASAGDDATLLAALTRVLASDEYFAQTAVASAIREKTPFVSNDLQDEARVLLRAEYAQAGVRSLAILPLMVAAEAIGVLVLLATESEFFHTEEMALLKEVSDDIAFASDHIAIVDKLNYLAYYDELTGIPNRRLFVDRVTQLIRIVADSGQRLAVFIVNLNRFKNVNESFGRAAGDAILRQVGQWLIEQTGDASYLARLEADRYAVVLPCVRPEGDLNHLIARWVQRLANHLLRVDDHPVRMSATVGAALFPDHGEKADLLLEGADAALKKARSNGRPYLLYDRDMNKEVSARLALEYKLRRAIDQEEFVLHYQPKVHIASGQLVGAEALIRWNDPEVGLVPPGMFIPLLEETGLIHRVGQWALSKAVSDYLRWRNAGLPAVRIAVNVSSLQLRDRSFVNELDQIIAIDSQAAAGLELEITESMIMEDIEHSITSLQAVRAKGITVAVDDFGTGFSSLGYVTRLPIDTLKIDRSFIVDMAAGPHGLALVSTIINLAHSLEFKVVAEGVETEEQLRLLRLLRCDQMQGYLFSKPLPSDAFEAKFLAPMATT